MDFRIPVFSVLFVCGLGWTFQALLLATGEASITFPALPSFTGGFLQDIAELAGFGADMGVFFVQFLSFAGIPGIPWWIQFPIAIICTTALILALFIIVIRFIEALGQIIPFTVVVAALGVGVVA